jgi:serine/threonine protein kinase
MAPEVLTQSRANAMKADIYALGIVLYQMFYQGVLPFEQRVDRILIFG